MKTKKPSAIIYGWRELGTFTLTSDIYFEENLMDEVVIYSLPLTDDIEKDFSIYKPDIIMGCDEKVSSNNGFLAQRIIRYNSFPPDNVLANDIVWVAQPTRICPPFGDVTLVNGVGIVKTTLLISKFEG